MQAPLDTTRMAVGHPPPEDNRRGELGEDQPVAHRRWPWRRFARHGLAVGSAAILVALALLALFAPLLAPDDPYAQTFDPTTLPDAAHWIGTDQLGRDELSRVIFGARVSLGIGASASLVAVMLGVLVGAVAGYVGGLTDAALMRLVNVMLAFPSLFLILIIAAVAGISQGSLVVLIGAFNWMALARLVRAEFLALKEQEYVQAAYATGVPSGRIIWRHILPNAMGSIIVAGTFILAGALFVEAALDFLGLGLSPDVPSWGNLLSSSEEVFYGTPLLAIVPGALLSLTILCVNFVGDGLRDALDPRMRA